MGFTVEDRYLIKCLRIGNGYGAKHLCKMFPDSYPRTVLSLEQGLTIVFIYLFAGSSAGLHEK